MSLNAPIAKKVIHCANGVTKETAGDLRKAMQESLDRMSADGSFTVELRTFKYDMLAHTVSGSFEFKAQPKNIEDMGKHSFLADHRKLTGAARINIRAEDYGAEVTVNGTRYKIMSLKPRSRKYSVIAMALSSSKLPRGKIGKSFKLHHNAVAKALGRAGVPDPDPDDFYGCGTDGDSQCG